MSRVVKILTLVACQVTIVYQTNTLTMIAIVVLMLILDSER